MDLEGYVWGCGGGEGGWVEVGADEGVGGGVGERGEIGKEVQEPGPCRAGWLVVFKE